MCYILCYKFIIKAKKRTLIILWRLNLPGLECRLICWQVMIGPQKRKSLLLVINRLGHFYVEGLVWRLGKAGIATHINFLLKKPLVK